MKELQHWKPPWSNKQYFFTIDDDGVTPSSSIVIHLYEKGIYQSWQYLKENAYWESIY